MRSRARRLAVLAMLSVVVAGCAVTDPGTSDDPATQRSPSPSPTTLDTRAAEELGDLAEEIAAAQASQTPRSSATGTDLPEVEPRVVVISIDGLHSAAIDAAATPAIYRLFVRGAGTLNARTAYERTETLPNHVCMVTGRRIDPRKGGHGVTWNTDTMHTVRPGVSSVFAVIDESGGSSAVIAGKPKLDIFRDSWPGAVDRFEVEPDMDRGADLVVDDLRTSDRDLIFWHLAGPDQAGHRTGWGSPGYDREVRRADAAVGAVIDAILTTPRLGAGVVVVLTSDHGGVVGTRNHIRQRHPANYTVPFVAWGPGVQAGDLYELNPGYADPGTGRPSYAGAQPVRNCDIANLVTDLLGVAPVPGSQLNPAQELALAE